MDTEKQVAKYLLDIKAVKLQPEQPFTWASGWRSPIYTYNRKSLSYPEVRKYLVAQFVEKIKKQYPDAELIAVYNSEYAVTKDTLPDLY